MMRKFLFSALPFTAMPVFQAPDMPAAGGGDPAPDLPQAKWFEGEGYDDAARSFLTNKGLASDDPLSVMPKLLGIARNAEQRIGRGLDTIIDRPAKDQPWAEWAKTNAAALGLPETAEAYTAAPPEDWPKDLPWDTALEAKARALAFENGVPQAAHAAYVGMFADHIKALEQASAEGFAKAQSDMMHDLQKDFGDRTPEVISNAKLGMQMLAEKAGIGADGVQSISQLLSDKTGDAGVIRLFAAVGELAGEDALLGRGGSSDKMTREEAAAEHARMHAPDGDYFKAVKTNDRNEIARLRPRIETLAKIMSRS